jgi:hypothetical protein
MRRLVHDQLRGAVHSRARVLAALQRARRKAVSAFLPGGHVEFSVSVDRERVKGRPENGIEEAPELEYIVRANGGQIFFDLPKQLGTVDLEFRRTPNIENRHYRFLIQQFETDAAGQFVHIGGMVYDVDATSTAPKQ